MTKQIMALVVALCLCAAASGCTSRESGLIESTASVSFETAQTDSVVLTLEGREETVLYTTTKSDAYPYRIGVDEQLFSFSHSDEEDIDFITYRTTGLDTELSARMSIFFQDPPEESGEEDYISLAAQMLEAMDYTLEDVQPVTVGKGNYSGQKILGSDGKRTQEFYSIPYGAKSVIVNLTYPVEGSEGVAVRMRHMLSTFEIDQ